ncbi:MAG TPA: hypothetical protein VFH92_12715, partial [Phenylobacterium sp.]|nr:hypothetical protein [Phenylobacterium sp.]
AVLGVGAGLVAATGAAGKTRAVSPLGSPAQARAILERYHGFGIKAAGGPGDIACGEWLEGELTALGYACVRQPFEVPAFDGTATLSGKDAHAELIPQAIVQPANLQGRLFFPPQGEGEIAIIDLPYARWSTAKGEVQTRVREAMALGARGAVLVTTGPSREALALNTPLDKPLFEIPVAVMSPHDAEPFRWIAAAHGTVRLTIAGQSFRRKAFNLSATLKRGARRSLVLSTPRSGWFTCAGERGSGLAVWLLLARWAATARLPVDLALVATSGHEYEYAGGEAYIREMAPQPGGAALWVHLGANVAARDWHERGPSLAPLPSADPQRFLLASPALIPAAQAAFAGQAGLEQVYAADPKQAAGELSSILAAGYDPVIGVFGAHRYHHARNDDLRCVSPDLIPPVANAFAQLISSTLQKVA